ncbi:MAG: hypothetical protein ACFNKE_00335, partial [Neisseria elongata]
AADYFTCDETTEQILKQVFMALDSTWEQSAVRLSIWHNYSFMPVLHTIKATGKQTEIDKKGRLKTIFQTAFSISIQSIHVSRAAKSYRRRCLPE